MNLKVSLRHVRLRSLAFSVISIETLGRFQAFLLTACLCYCRDVTHGHFNDDVDDNFNDSLAAEVPRRVLIV